MSSPGMLSVILTDADSIHFWKDYTLIVKIRDKRYNGSFTAKPYSNVLANRKLNVDATKLSRQ
jgi:hypothetical protein